VSLKRRIAVRAADEIERADAWWGAYRLSASEARGNVAWQAA
jgi:hypothetical protein